MNKPRSMQEKRRSAADLTSPSGVSEAGLEPATVQLTASRRYVVTLWDCTTQLPQGVVQSWRRLHSDTFTAISGSTVVECWAGTIALQRSPDLH
jgi:hypothetical protein